MDKFPKVNSTLASLIVAAVAAVVVALGVEHWRVQQAQRVRDQVAPIAAVPTAPVATPQRSASTPAGKTATWVASAPGRVEPRDGEVRVGSQVPGRVVQVLARMNDVVKAGDVLVRLGDDDVAVKLTAAMAEASVRRRERDSEPAVKLVADRRVAEDNLSFAERAAFKARMDLDRLQFAQASGTAVSAAEFEAARKAIVEANDKLEQERANLRKVAAQPGMPLPTRLEASLAAARAELGVIENAMERTRVRAPADGNILLVNTKVGETVSPSPEDILLVFGDLSQLRVRAELEERDIGKIRPGQPVIVRSDAFPGQDFTGTVERIANALGAPRIVPKGPRRPADQDVLQVLINLDGRPPLVSGIRVDVFFRPDATAGAPTPAAPRAN